MPLSKPTARGHCNPFTVRQHQVINGHKSSLKKPLQILSFTAAIQELKSQLNNKGLFATIAMLVYASGLQSSHAIMSIIFTLRPNAHNRIFFPGTHYGSFVQTQERP